MDVHAGTVPDLRKMTHAEVEIAVGNKGTVLYAVYFYSNQSAKTCIIHAHELQKITTSYGK